jgi:uncharacterized OsmC-like protein
VSSQVLLVLAIPIEFDFVGHKRVLYRNVYTQPDAVNRFSPLPTSETPVTILHLLHLHRCMVTTTVRFLYGVRFEVEARGHKVLCDQPADNGGADSGITPPEFLLGSLGTCAGYYALQYLKTRNLSTGGLTVTVEAGKGTQPTRLDNFRILIDVPGLEDERHREGVVRAAKNCLIHNTMLHAPSIEIALTDNAVLATDFENAWTASLQWL